MYKRDPYLCFDILFLNIKCFLIEQLIGFDMSRTKYVINHIISWTKKLCRLLALDFPPKYLYCFKRPRRIIKNLLDNFCHYYNLRAR